MCVTLQIVKFLNEDVNPQFLAGALKPGGFVGCRSFIKYTVHIFKKGLELYMFSNLNFQKK